MILVAQSATKAFDILGVEAPERAGAGVDLVLLDVMMPEMSVSRPARQIKAREHLRDIPIIMVTGHSDKELRELGGGDRLRESRDVQLEP